MLFQVRIYILPLKNLWKALEHYNISNSIIRAIKRLYENTFSKIKIGKQLSSGFHTTKGLRQGCSLSPTLFKTFIQNALENLQKKCAKMGSEIQDTTIYTMLFADDQLLIAQDYEDLEYMTKKLIDEYELWGLKLNLKKINTLCGHRRHIKRFTTTRREGNNKSCK